MNIDNSPEKFSHYGPRFEWSRVRIQLLEIVASQEHLSFTLSIGFPACRPASPGSVRIIPSASPADQFLAWTLNVDQGLMTSLPPTPTWPRPICGRRSDPGGLSATWPLASGSGRARKNDVNLNALARSSGDQPGTDHQCTRRAGSCPDRFEPIATDQRFSQ